MQNIEKFLKAYGIHILICVCLLLGLLSLKFRNSTLDDDLYLLETSIMTEALSRGKWIGNYATGIHGFLFKLPVALIFLLTGPSLAIATIWNIVLGCILLYLFYKLLRQYFGNTLFPLAGTILLLANFQFILHLPTYMREFPVVLSLLLFIYLLSTKRSYWIVGLSLLLILDAKESVFFMILPGFLLYILIAEWTGFKIKDIWRYIRIYFQTFSASAIYLLLMLFTSLIPLNTVIFTVIPGVTEGGVEYQLQHFEVGAATQSIVRLKTPEATTIQQIVPIEEETESTLHKVFGIVMGYIGKLLYPRSFSFLSIPKILFFPALFTSIVMFKSHLKKKKKEYIALTLMFWSFLSVYIFRLSFDRYLFPILPVIFIFYLLFLKEIVGKKKTYIWIVAISSILALVGLIFEADYLYIKLGLNILIIVGYVIFYLLHKKHPTTYFYLSCLVAALTFSVVGYYFFSLGQLRQYINFGKDYEVKEVVSLFGENETIMLNDTGWDLLPGIYRGNRKYDPEWKWALKDWVPRKKDLRMFDDMNTYPMDGENIEQDKIFVEYYGIQKIGLVVSNLERFTFKNQERLEEYMKANWLEFTETVQLKNKTVYIFKVIR
jgi:4-amino-4-deoxy-L-arabinose transferase-like glycosyltransferase